MHACLREAGILESGRQESYSADLSGAVQWWEEWQLRILVLGSLFLQFVLFMGSMMRHARIPMLRLCMWLAYLGSDALAIYALATLFNRHKQPPAAGGAVEVIWAPVLLIHLGGQHAFTAYSIEDNELWRRHLVTLVSQVTVALYVFCKSWPAGGDKRLMQAAILLFVLGIFRFAWKPWGLKIASINSVMTSSAIYPKRRQGMLQKICECLCLSIITTGRSFKEAEAIKEEEEHDCSLEEYVQKARHLVQVTEVADGGSVHVKFTDAERLFVDMSAPYHRRLRNLQSYLRFDIAKFYPKLMADLWFAFALIYTNYKTAMSVSGLLVHLLLPFLALASLVLFATSHHNKDDAGYDEIDTRITMVLLCCTASLELLPLFLSRCILESSAPFVTFVTGAEHNLMSFYTRRSKPTLLMRISALMGLSSYINKHWYIEQGPPHEYFHIIEFVVEHVKQGWELYIFDAPSYQRFCNLRGQWALSRQRLSGQQLLWSLKVPFDRSVLVWHIATELCAYHPRTSAQGQANLACYSRAISNYMIYLLLVQPELLMPGTRQGLFTAACDETELMLSYLSEPTSPSARDVAQQILATARFPLVYPGTLVPDARDLAEELMGLLEHEEERWKVIQGVWVEMLCYSASRCRGYLHAKSLGEGIEFLTMVWLLLSRMGMETFADKFQRPGPGQGEDDIVTGHASPSGLEPQEDIPVEEEISIV